MQRPAIKVNEYVRLLRAKVTQLQMVHDRGFDLNEYPEEVKFLQSVMGGMPPENLIRLFFITYGINPESKEIARANLSRIYHLSLPTESVSARAILPPQSRYNILPRNERSSSWRSLYAYYVPVSRDDTQAKKASIDPLLDTIKNNTPNDIVVISPVNLGSDAQKQLTILKDIRLNIFLESVLQYNVTHHILVPRHEAMENDDMLLARTNATSGITDEQKRELALRIALLKGKDTDRKSDDSDAKFMMGIQARMADKIRAGEAAFSALLKAPLNAEEKAFVYDYLRIGSIYDEPQVGKPAEERLLTLLNNRRKYGLTTSGPRVTSKYITRFERAHILGARADAISKGADIMVDLELGDNDPMIIAIKEFRQGKIPLIIRRDLPDGSFEDISLRDLLPLEDLGYDLATNAVGSYSKEELTESAYLRELARLALPSGRTLNAEEKAYFRNPALTNEVIKDLLDKRGITDVKIPERPDEMWYYSVLASRKKYSPLTDVEKGYFNSARDNPENFFTLLNKRKYSREYYQSALAASDQKDTKLSVQEEALFANGSADEKAFVEALNRRLYNEETLRREGGYYGPLSPEEKEMVARGLRKDTFQTLVNQRKYNKQDYEQKSGVDEKNFNMEEKAFFSNPSRDGAGFIELLNKRATRKSLSDEEKTFLTAIKARDFQPIPDSAHTRFLATTGFAPSQLEQLKHTDPVAQYYGLTSGTIVRIYRVRLFLETLVNTSVAYRIVV